MATCNNNIIMNIHTVTPMTLCFVWPLQSSLPVSSVILVPHPTSPLQYKSHSDTLNMTRYTYLYQSPGCSQIFNPVHVTLKMGPGLHGDKTTITSNKFTLCRNNAHTYQVTSVICYDCSVQALVDSDPESSIVCVFWDFDDENE